MIQTVKLNHRKQMMQYISVMITDVDTASEVAPPCNLMPHHCMETFEFINH